VQRAGLRVRICVCGGMIDHATGSFRFDDHSRGVAFFQLIGDLHTGAWRRARLRPENHLRTGLATLNGDVVHIDVHGAQVESVDPYVVVGQL